MHQYISQIRKKGLVWGLVLLLGLITFLIWVLLLVGETTQVLKVSFLNVGQGDAIFIETPAGVQILIDGGNGEAVLQELSHVMSFFDKSIDIVVATHPDSDHVGGLVDVVQRYDVGLLIHSSVVPTSEAAHALFEYAQKHNIPTHVAQRGDVFDFGDGAYLSTLFPDRDVAYLEPNDASVVLQLAFGEHSFLFTGDAPQSIENYLVTLDQDELRSDVLKAGHHGSKTSTSDIFVGFVDPQYVVLSRGCDNSYGHPHQEVLDILDVFLIDVHDTCTEGRITFLSDGVLLQGKNSHNSEF